MPSKTETTWTCSRCGKGVIVPAFDPERHPIGWRLVMIEQYQPGVARDYTGDLCGDCRTLLQSFLDGTELWPADIPFMSDEQVAEARRREADRRSGVTR